MTIADSTFARFLREGGHSVDDTYKLAKRTTAIGLTFTAVGGLVIVACAPLLPRVLGEKWEPAVIVTQLLAFVPMLVSMQMYAFNALMGLGRQRSCLIVTVTAAVINIALKPSRSSPHFEWRGSTAATFVAEPVSVVALWTLLWREVHVHAPPREHLRSV